MNFSLPAPTDFYKFLLVEELALCSNPALIHYGNCSVIGYLMSSDRLGSLTIPNIKQCHQIPDCSLEVKLAMEFHPKNYLNSTVEVFGEVKLYNPSSPSDDLESAHSLIQKLRILQTSLEEARGLPARSATGTNDQSLHYLVRNRLQKTIDEFKRRYKAVIQVHTIRHIQDARDIIGENLHFRLIQNLCKSRKKD